MRNLEKYVEQSGVFEGTIVTRQLSKGGFINYCLRNIKCDDNTKIRHMWNHFKKSVEKQIMPYVEEGINQHINIKFEAKAYEYTRKDGTKDYALKIDKILKISK